MPHTEPPVPRGGELRSLFWQLLPHRGRHAVTVRLHADAALCFGDVARVLLILHRDDAELDDPRALHHYRPHCGYDGGRDRNSRAIAHERPGRDNSIHAMDVEETKEEKESCDESRSVDVRRLQRLHPPGYRRVKIRNGMPEEGESALPRVIIGGATESATRQICSHTGLQRDSTLHVIVPKPFSPWRTLPRPMHLHHCHQRDHEQRCLWALPVDWDEGLREAVANHDSLQLSGRSDLIASHLRQVR